MTTRILYLSGRRIINFNSLRLIFNSNSKILCRNVASMDVSRFIQKKMAIQYPEVRRDESVTDNYFGSEIKDPYRWLENPDAEETQKFVEAQNGITKPFLDGCEYRDAIDERLKNLWDYPKYSCPKRHGNKYFFYMNSGLQNQSVLYVQDDLNSEPSVFLDPNLLSEDGTVALSINKFSEDGSIFAYGLSSSGSDWTTIHFKNVETKQDYPDVLEKVKFSRIAWTHDNKGIFYGSYKDQTGKTDGSETLSNENQKLYYHRIGTPQSEDVLAVEFPEEPQFKIGATISHCGRYLIISPVICNDSLLYFCDLEKLNYKITKKLPLVQVVHKLEAEYQYVTNTGPEFVFKTNKNAPNYRLIKINFENIDESKWETLVAENPLDVLDWAISVHEDKLVICYMHHVKDVLQLHNLSDGKLIHKFPMEVGTVVEFSGDKKHSEIFYQVMGFLTPGEIYRCDLKDTPIEPKLFREIKTERFQKDLYTSKQVFYESKDGTKIPMFLVHRNDLILNGENPCLLYGYGGFNISLKPYFDVTQTVYIQHLNGILAVPNIRGGGEYGEKWHNQGRLANKQNGFDDFIAAAEYLISEKYTNNKLLTINGGSNGGLLIGACINQRPDLFGAAVCQVGVLDMLRFHKFTIGSAWISDYGSPDVEDQFKYLVKYSPLHNIKVPEGTVEYPATLLTTADHDDRVVPLHSLKFIATLQHTLKNVPKQTNPLLIRIETKAGHGFGKPTSKMIEEATGILCFIIQALKLKFMP